MDARPIIKYVPDDRLGDLACEFRCMAERATTLEIRDDLIELAERIDELAQQLQTHHSR
jgi:hypothetical protein